MSTANELLQELQTPLASGQLDLEQFDLGPVSAYAIAKAHGFTGTEEEFAAMIANAAIAAAAADSAARAAATSEANAGASARAAATSETNAQTFKENAAASATAAERSKTASATSETNAAASQRAAKTSEDNAKASETAAAEKKDQTQALYDEFNDKLKNAQIYNTKETATFDSEGRLVRIVHTDNATGATVRTDEFTYTGEVITEVRTLPDGRTQTNTYDMLSFVFQYNV